MSYADEVVFIGDQPVEYENLDPLPWSDIESVRKQDRPEYMEAAEEVCREQGVPFISISENVDREEFREKLVDSLHPGTEGHRQIYRIVKDRLVREKIV